MNVGPNEVAGGGTFSVPLSFPIPLSAPTSNVVLVPPPAETNPDPTHCAGVAANPSAANGYLCVYLNQMSTTVEVSSEAKFIDWTQNPFFLGAESAGRSGTALLMVLKAKAIEDGASGFVAGSFAVTG